MVSKLTPRLAGAFFIFIFLFISCDDTPTVTQDEKDAFIGTYVNLTLAKIKFKNQEKKYKTIRSSIYNQHGTSEQFLNEFRDKIESNYKLQQEVFKAISERLEDFEKIPSDSLNRYLKNLMMEP
ncbi:MAG: hypothetical protein GY839_17040 [candidate division Zixibacteria bacterium]|nr:hypothetical protein [candidate division Zixibacteria bacterium]